VYIRYKKLAIVEIPKCASTSLSSIVASHFVTTSVVRHATLQQYKNAYPDILGGVAVVRDPAERFRSAVRFFVQKNPENISSFNLKGAISNLRYADRVLPIDAIFFPQYSFLMSDVPVRVYSIDRMRLLLSHLEIDKTPEVLNPSIESDSASSIIDDIGRSFVEDFYSIDFALYRDVVLSSDGFLELQNPREYFYSIR
jgi:hypothetical protein